MSKEVFTTQDLYQYYAKHTPPGPFRLSELSFQTLLKSGARKLIARDGSGIRCMVLYLPLGDTNYLLCQCGNAKKLKGKITQGSYISTAEKASEVTPVKTFLRIFCSKKQWFFWQESLNYDFEALTWFAVPDEQFPGLYKFQLYGPLKDLWAEFAFWKCIFQGKNTVSLVYIDFKVDKPSILSLEILLRMLLLISFQTLGGEVFVLCDDLLPGYERFCDDFYPLYRSEARPFFLC